MVRFATVALLGQLWLKSSHGGVTWSKRQRKTLTFRGGDQETTSNKKEEPDWLDVDRETVQNYMTLARQRHAKDVQSARNAYWSATSEEDKSISSDDLSNVELDTYGIIPHGDASWSLPDFENELDTSKMIFVTRGASVSGKGTPLFEPQECQAVVEAAEEHFAQHNDGEWTKLPSGQYDVAGFWIKDVPKVHAWFNDMVKKRLFPLLAQQFPEFCTVQDLVVDNAYLFKYTTETGKRTGVHTDSGCLSFTIAMGGDYEGGGTWIEGLASGDEFAENSLMEMQQGHVTVRPGGVRHCGHAVTSGTRYIIGGFCMHSAKVEYVRMLIGLGSELSKQGKFRQAQEALEAALVLNPDFDGAYTHLADALQKQGNTQRAIQVLERCFQNVNPLNGEVAYTLGVLYLEKELYAKAQECLQACVDVDDMDETAMLALAQVCAATGDRDGERNWYEKVIRIPGLPKDAAASAYCNLGVLSEGDYDKEIECYQKALELVPNNFQSRYSLASAYAMQDQWNLAAESFRLAVDLVSTLQDSQQRQQHESKVLSALYQVAINIVNEGGEPSSPTENMRQLNEIMGQDNFQKLVAIRRGQS